MFSKQVISFNYLESKIMKLVKPEWHIGDWTKEQQELLIDELLNAEKERSLTKEEKEWLLAIK